MAALRLELGGLAIGDKVDDLPLSEAADGLDSGNSSIQDESVSQSPLGSDTSSLSEGPSHEGVKLLYSSAGRLAYEDEEVGIE
jgi:hypothetical protein